MASRDRLLEYDRIGGHGVVKDQTSDWYELENDTWQSKEQRDFAKKIREYEERKIVDEEDAVYLNIGGEGKEFVGVSKGKATKTEEMINQEANEYINELVADKIARNIKKNEYEELKTGFKDVTIKSCEFLDEKSKELLKKLKEETYKKQEEQYKLNSKKVVYAEIKDPKAAADSSFHERLQSENPFVEFQKELEKALKKKEMEDKLLAEQEKEKETDLLFPKIAS